MNTPASLGHSVAYSRMLQQPAQALDRAHIAFLQQLDQPVDEPARVLSTAEKRAALAAGQRARGEDRRTAAMAGIAP